MTSTPSLPHFYEMGEVKGNLAFLITSQPAGLL